MGNTVITIDQNKITEFNQHATKVVSQAQDYEISCIEDNEFAFTLRQEYKRRIEAIIAFFKESKSLAAAAHKAICKNENDLVAPYEQADAIMERKRLEFKRKRDEADERERQKKERELAEQQQKELEAEAKRLEKAGDKEQAQEVREIAKNPPPVSVAPVASVPKQKGSVIKKRWKFEIQNPDLIQRQYLLPVDKKLFDPAAYPRIQDVVDALGDKCNIAGIRAFQVESEDVRQ